MAGTTGPHMPSDGLIFSLDFSNDQCYTSGSTILSPQTGLDITPTILGSNIIDPANGGGLYVADQNDLIVMVPSPQNLEAGFSLDIHFTFIGTQRNGGFDASGGLIDGIGGGTVYYSNSMYCTSGQLKHYYEASGSGGSLTLNTSNFPNTLVSGSLASIGLTWDGTDYKVFQDGVQFNSYTPSAPPNMTPQRNMRIGIWGSGYTVIGNYHKMDLWGRALSDAEMLASYNSIKDRFGYGR